jgi:hypothetical protein
VKAFSTSGEFAFVSFGANAKGIVAIGMMAHGVIAFGGVLAIGVVSIGMNAIGSVCAVGMNAAAPISISAINGIGVWTLAGVNGWGTWTRAGTNASGVVSDGGVNSWPSLIPSLIVFVALVVASFVAPGKRERRTKLPTLRDFLAAPDTDRHVTAWLGALDDGATLELEDEGARVHAELSEPAARSARAILEGGPSEPQRVLVHLEQATVTVHTGGDAGYRDRPEREERVVVRCLDLQRAPAVEHWLPKDRHEIQWTIAWSARIAAAAALALLSFALLAHGLPDRETHSSSRPSSVGSLATRTIAPTPDSTAPTAT